MSGSYTSFIESKVPCQLQLPNRGCETRGRIQRKTWCMGPNAGVNDSITSPNVHSRVDFNTFTMGIGQPYARVDLNPMPESTLYPSHLWIWPLLFRTVRLLYRTNRLLLYTINRTAGLFINQNLFVFKKPPLNSPYRFAC